MSLPGTGTKVDSGIQIPTGADPWAGAAGRGVVRAMRLWAAQNPEGVALRYLERGEHEADSASYAQLDRDARIVAAHLRAAGAVRRPVPIALPQGLDFVRCLLGCLYAGAIPVPCPSWDDPRAAARIAAIIEQARPALVIAAPRDGRAPPHLARPAELLRGPPDPPRHDPTPDDIALLQYTSGSTSRPKGVVITHGNLSANLEMIRAGFAITPAETTVSWLPLHHDMGLIGNVLAQLQIGAASVLMSPLAFLQRPARWLHAISRYRAATGGGPNFGYELCLRGGGVAVLGGVDLSCWRLAFCGAEPVRADTLRRFAARFAPSGFQARSFYPCYGLAEATLFVTGARAGEGPRMVEGVATPGGISVSCGIPRLDCEIALLEPDAPARVPPGAIGEIAIAGAHVSPGFWDPARGIVPDAARGLRLDGRRFLRSGDLGRIIGGELHVVGRASNMVVLHGANIHAEDVERTVAALPGFDAVAALPIVDAAAEGFVLACEMPRGASPEAMAALLPTASAAVAEAHGLVPLETLLLSPGAIARTLSGKLRREATRDAYREQRLPVLARHAALPSRAGRPI